MSTENLGALAAALAKAQASFPTISRDKEVTVTTKTGGSYKFKYAPLESIVAAVRKPLSDNGLAVVQLLDDDFLVTSLYHEGGAVLSGRTPIPATEGIQAFGSAITYLRRYSIVALLGIATEEDDDGNHAEGNAATFGGRAPRTAPAPRNAPAAPDGARRSFTGMAVRWQKPGLDGQLRMDPEGIAHYGFIIECEDTKKRHVKADGSLAEYLAGVNPVGQVVTVAGTYRVEDLENKDGSTYKAGVIYAQSITAPDGSPLAATPSAPPADAPKDPEIDGLVF